MGATGAASDEGQVGQAGSGMGGKAAGREQAAIVKDDVEQVARPVTRQGCQRPQVHQDRPVAIQHHDLFIGQIQRHAQANRRGQPHGMLQVEKVFAVAQIIQLLGARPHDRHDQTLGKFRIERFNTLGTLHRSPSVKFVAPALKGRATVSRRSATEGWRGFQPTR